MKWKFKGFFLGPASRQISWKVEYDSLNEAGEHGYFHSRLPSTSLLEGLQGEQPNGCGWGERESGGWGPTTDIPI